MGYVRYDVPGFFNLLCIFLSIDSLGPLDVVMIIKEIWHNAVNIRVRHSIFFLDPCFCGSEIQYSYKWCYTNQATTSQGPPRGVLLVLLWRRHVEYLLVDSYLCSLVILFPKVKLSLEGYPKSMKEEGVSPKWTGPDGGRGQSNADIILYSLYNQL